MVCLVVGCGVVVDSGVDGDGGLGFGCVGAGLIPLPSVTTVDGPSAGLVVLVAVELDMDGLSVVVVVVVVVDPLCCPLFVVVVVDGDGVVVVVVV